MVVETPKLGNEAVVLEEEVPVETPKPVKEAVAGEDEAAGVVTVDVFNEKPVNAVGAVEVAAVAATDG